MQKGVHDTQLGKTWLKVGNSKLASPPTLFSRPFSLHSPSINYTVYPFESFTLSPFEKMLGSWYPEFVHIHVSVGIHKTKNNNQEDPKHQSCFKFHPFNSKNIAYKSIQFETCFGKL